MERVRLALTDKQMNLLRPVFDVAPVNNRMVKGMIVGQFFETTDGGGYFEVGFIDEVKSLQLQQSLGVPVVSLSPDKVCIYTDVD